MPEGDLLRIRSGPQGLVAGALAVLFGVRRLAAEPAMRRLALVPVALTAVLYAVLVTVIAFFADDVLAWAWAQPESGVLRWVWYVLVPFVFLALLVPLVLMFMTIAEAVGGPFYDRMAIRVLEGHGMRATDPGLIRGTVPDLLRSSGFALVGLTFAALSLVPVVGVAFGAIATLVAWLGFASAAINPALQVSGLGLGARVRYTFSAFATMAGMGAVIGVSLMVPLLGLVSLPAAVIGAAELYARTQRAVQPLSTLRAPSR
ncbi:EI24 domain-containing protein [Myxococcota bacterium]|nr:EI24 domain-containing protein [Myxococcota bacterium]